MPWDSDGSSGGGVVDEASVVAALDGASLTDLGTPASGDKILLQDADDSSNLKVAQFSTFGGGSGGLAELAVPNDGTNDFFFIPGVVCSSTSTLSLTTDTDSFFPFTCFGPVTIDKAYVEFTSSPGYDTYFAIYAADTQWQPTTLKCTGMFAGGASGVKSITGLACSLTTGHYVAALNPAATTTYRCNIGGPAQGLPIKYTLGTSPFMSQWYGNRTAATFPSSSSGWTLAAYGSTAFKYPIYFGV